MLPQLGQHRVWEQLTGSVIAPSAQIVAGLLHAGYNCVKDFDCLGGYFGADSVASDDRQLHERRSSSSLRPPRRCTAGGAPTASSPARPHVRSTTLSLLASTAALIAERTSSGTSR